MLWQKACEDRCPLIGSTMDSQMNIYFILPPIQLIILILYISAE